jgi:hypothetical protein
LAFKPPAVGTETKFIQVRLQVLGSQTMVGTADKRFGIGNHRVQPFQMIGVSLGVKLEGW